MDPRKKADPNPNWLAFPCFHCKKVFVLPAKQYVGNLFLCDDCTSMMPPSGAAGSLPTGYPPMTLPPPTVTPETPQPDRATTEPPTQPPAIFPQVMPSNNLALMAVSPMSVTASSLPPNMPVQLILPVGMPLMNVPPKPMVGALMTAPPIWVSPTNEAASNNNQQKVYGMVYGNSFVKDSLLRRPEVVPNSSNQYPDMFTDQEAEFFFGSDVIGKYIHENPWPEESKLMKLMNPNSFKVNDYRFEVKVDNNSKKVTIQTIPNYA